MDSSKILVMDAGTVKEFDTVPNLIKNKDSVFNQMINATGREMSRALRKMAKEIEILKSVNSSRLELSEKIQEKITAIEEDRTSDIEEDYLDGFDPNDLSRRIDEELSKGENNSDKKSESTHF